MPLPIERLEALEDALALVVALRRAEWAAKRADEQLESLLEPTFYRGAISEPRPPTPPAAALLPKEPLSGSETTIRTYPDDVSPLRLLPVMPPPSTAAPPRRGAMAVAQWLLHPIGGPCRLGHRLIMPQPYPDGEVVPPVWTVWRRS